MKRATLEKGYVHSQSTSAREKWTLNKGDVSDCASRIDNHLTTDRTTARFEATLEVYRHSHFSRYRSSCNRSSSAEDRDVSHGAVLQYSGSYSVCSNLPNLKLNTFDGNTLERPEWTLYMALEVVVLC